MHVSYFKRILHGDYRLHTSISYGGGFVNKIKKAILEVFVLLLKKYSFIL